MALVALVIVLAITAYQALMLLRRGMSIDQLPAEVLRRSFLVLLALLVLGLTWFWPWYVLWLLPFAVLVTRKDTAALMIAFTASAFAIHWTAYYKTFVGDRQFQYPLVALVFAPVAVTAAYVAVKSTRTPPAHPLETGAAPRNLTA